MFLLTEKFSTHILLPKPSNISTYKTLKLMADSIGLKSQQVGHRSSRHVRRVWSLVLGPRSSVLSSIQFALSVIVVSAPLLLMSPTLSLGHNPLYHTIYTIYTIYTTQWTHNDSDEWKCANKYVCWRRARKKKQENCQAGSLFIVRSQIQHLRNYCANLGTQVDLFFRCHHPQ